MKSDLKIKFLSYMAQRKKGEGFTLIELLVVIIIIGILAAIALPSFLNQSNKAKQSEARQYVGALVRAQQAYYLEESEFASDFDQLARVTKEDTTNYEYKITPGGTKGGDGEKVDIEGDTKKGALKSYAGLVIVRKVTGVANESTTFGSVCESTDIGNNGKAVAVGDIDAKGKTTCTAGKELGEKKAPTP
jgi:type IV pilus assembly protein PilA